MNCRGVSLRLSAYIDGDLSPGIRQSIDEHLKNCAACRDLLAQLGAIVKTANDFEPLKVSEGFVERVLKVARSSATTTGVVDRWRSKVTYGVVAFVTAAFAVLFFMGPPSDDTSIPLPKEQVSIHGESSIDFHRHPEAKIDNFPVLEDVQAEIATSDSIMLADSLPKIDEFILPEMQRVIENVNVKY